MKRQSLILLSVAGLLLAGVTMIQARQACRTGELRAADGAARAAAGAGPRRVAAEGRVATFPGGDVVLGAEESGRLVRLEVREGDRVKAGQLLGEIDSRTWRDNLAEIEARLAEADAEIRLARLTLGRRTDLEARQVLSTQEVDVARRDLEVAEAQRAALVAQAARCRTGIDRCRIVAPIDGVVVRRHADRGEMIEAGRPVVTVADVDHLRIEGEADEADAGQIRVGDQVRVTADGYPGQSWTGRVDEAPAWVEPRALKPQDPTRLTDTRVLPVKVVIDGGSPLRLGQTVDLMIESTGGRLD